jgi:Protein of unknown function (DUF3014)
MGQLDDTDLERTDAWTPRSRGPARRWRAGVLVIGLLALAAASVGWWLTANRASAPGRPGPSAVAPTGSGGQPIVREYPDVALPPLDALDPVVRELAGGLTTSPLLGPWLATSDLARQLAALANGAAAWRLPLRLLAPIRPAGTFAVVERDGRTVISPASHARYDALSEVIAGLDPVAVAGAYRTLAPRLEEAHRELGETDRSLDAVVRTALTQVIDTPVPDGPMAVTPQGGLYAFADPRLEGLSPAQKLLLRSGPANARRIQAQFRAIVAALDAPATATP